MSFDILRPTTKNKKLDNESLAVLGNVKYIHFLNKMSQLILFHNSSLLTMLKIEARFNYFWRGLSQYFSFFEDPLLEPLSRNELMVLLGQKDKS